MEKIEEPGKVVLSQEKHYSDFEPGAIPIAPDGGIVPGYGAEPLPPAIQLTAQNSVCVRGPCRYYWHVVTDFPAGNPESTWDGKLIDPKTGLPVTKPQQHNHSCLVQPGLEMDMTEDVIFACNRWDPVDPQSDEALEREARRELYQIRLAPKPASARPMTWWRRLVDLAADPTPDTADTDKKEISP